MIAPKHIPKQYAEWNLRHGAPFGFHYPLENGWSRFIPESLLRKIKGPFSMQPNNTTRVYEYPWAFYAGNIMHGQKIVEVGGSLSGFQFTLNKSGCEVVNIDPGLDAIGVGWPCTQESIARLNRIFGTSVELRNTTIDKAQLTPNGFQTAFSISVLEHLPKDEIELTMKTVFQSLEPGGKFVITLDLFVNAQPFCSQSDTEFGKNIDVKWLTELAPFEMELGDRKELYGFPEFSADQIQMNLNKYLLGSYPALTQLLVLKKP